jgi:hypothetical protein
MAVRTKGSYVTLSAIALLGACVSPDDQRATCMVDDFSTPSIDTRVWGIYQQPPTTIEQRDGALVSTLADGVAAYASVYSVQDIDFRDTAASVEVLEVPDVEGAEVLLQWVVNNRYRHFIAVEAGRIYFGTQNGGDYETRETPYDPIVHRHWRLRHDSDGDRVTYETSTDGASWVARHVSGRLIPLHEAYVELAAGSYVDVERPGTAALDNFELAGACAP